MVSSSQLTVPNFKTPILTLLAACAGSARQALRNAPISNAKIRDRKRRSFKFSLPLLLGPARRSARSAPPQFLRQTRVWPSAGVQESYGASSARVATHTLPIPTEFARFDRPLGKTADHTHRHPSSFPSRRRSQPVAMASHGLQQRFATRGIDLAPQPRDVDVYDIGERVLAIAPYLVEDASAGEDSAGRAHQKLEDCKFLGRELDGVATAPHLQQLAIEDEVGNLQNVGVGREFVRPAHQSLDAGKQLVEIERLGEIVVGAQFQALDLVFQGVHGGQHQNRRVIALETQTLTHVVAVHVGEHQIEHDNIELAGLGEVHPRASRRSDGPAMIFGPEPAVDEVGDARLVFDEKDVHAAASVLAAGSATVTVVPSPGRLAISILPLWASTIARATGRPRPKPSAFMVEALPPRPKRSKIPSSSSAGMPMPRSETRTVTSPPSLPISTFTSPLDLE